MKLDSNNNRGIIYRIAKSNLMGNKLYSLFAFLSIFLSVAFVSTMILFLQGTQTVEKRMLDNMQHVMFMNVSEEQMKHIQADRRTEIMLPYKSGEETFQMEGVTYSFTYLPSQEDKIQTYVLAEGKEPDAYNEIVVDKYFMESMGLECSIGTKLLLYTGDGQEEFIICGYAKKENPMSVNTIYVSGEFANRSRQMKDIGYTALVRIVDASYLEASAFETIVYEMAADYGIKRVDVNINGKFEEHLREGSTLMYVTLFVSVVILAASAIVIYSIFYLSVTSRTQQIGQLQTIGMTQRQIKSMVRWEGFLLCGISIPVGLLLGGFLAYFLEGDGWNLVNYFIVMAVVGTFDLLTVQISLRKPAKLAALVAPVEASRGFWGEDNWKEDVREHKRLTAFVMAEIGQGRNSKKRRIMTASLGFGGIIFMLASSYLCAWDEDAYSRQEEFENAEYVVSYRYNAHNPLAYGPTEMQLGGHLSEGLKKELEGIPSVESVKESHSAFGSIEFQGATWVQGFHFLTEDSREYFDLNVEGNGSYEYLAKHDGIVVTNSEFYEGINGVTLDVGNRLTFRWFDGEEHSREFEIAAVTKDSVPGNGGNDFYMTDKTAEKLWGSMNTTDALLISALEYETNGDQVEQDISAVIEPYTDLSLDTLREHIQDDAFNIQKIKIQIYGISAFLILFSILNLINMVIGNLATRKKELSMLESIGMEERQIRKMLFWECIQLVFPAIFITLVLGGACGYGFVYFLKQLAGYMVYRFPIIPSLLYVLGVILIPVAISYVSLKAQNKTSLVERMRYVD